MYAGGPLSTAVGDELARAGVPLSNMYGGTEFGSPLKPWDQQPPETLGRDWAWYIIHEDSNSKFEPQGDGTYELVVHVSPP